MEVLRLYLLCYCVIFLYYNFGFWFCWLVGCGSLLWVSLTYEAKFYRISNWLPRTRTRRRPGTSHGSDLSLRQLSFPDPGERDSLLLLKRQPGIRAAIKGAFYLFSLQHLRRCPRPQGCSRAARLKQLRQTTRALPPQWPQPAPVHQTSRSPRADWRWRRWPCSPSPWRIQ